ncbi:unnamed protein product [Rotaria sordida]|uniref:Ribosomal RNA-processing protein 14/surfeit locus protein 6 C-terminal domain-containing protein n=1 Tax=Rotaria sordida TaxID=392033 RepID=A0A814A3V2_9BILA|nr:unnamed protein product [Rotaria sordida]CAF0730236.1 unnamed protein product [Rotaria sordida]CAF0731634.1 unnamed protein product [Rotaria sordida]CAF0908126.1 unnamed protein product [Rotaria sordida]
MTDTDINTSDVNITQDDAIHRHPEIEHFLNLNTILHSLVDFIRPETYIAQDELQTYNELKDKFLRESTLKRNKQQQKIKGQTSTSSLEVAGIESIRTTSGIYRFLAHHHKNNPSTNNNKQKSDTSISREELLKKLHEKMPHRQQQTENGIDHTVKRKHTKDKSKEREKKARISTKEWTKTTSSSSNDTHNSKSSTIPNQITFGRFEFNTEDSIDTKSKKKKSKKFQSKQKQLINTLKQVESEQNELNRLQEENPEQGKELLRSKHWKTALAKAKGEKIRDNIQLLRKTIKKQNKRREQSAKKWQQNKSETEKRVKERQEKRKDNLQKRKDDKKAKLKKKLIKKGRLVN